MSYLFIYFRIKSVRFFLFPAPRTNFTLLGQQGPTENSKGFSKYGLLTNSSNITQEFVRKAN